MADLSIYLIAKYTGQPKDPKQTHKAGYMKDPANIEYEEQDAVNNLNEGI
jgi:hypothetical protein